MSETLVEELPDGPVTGPDGVAVRLNVSRTAAVGQLLQTGDDDVIGFEASVSALLLVKALRLVQVHVFRVKPWTVTVASAAPNPKVVHRRYRTQDEARLAAFEIVDHIRAEGVAGF